MFNSISDWIKLPQQVQMPTVNMPSMPKMPDIFGMNHKKEGGETTTSSEADTNEAGKDMQQQQQQQQQQTAAAQQQQQEAGAEQASTSGEAANDDPEKKKKMPIDIDPSKAIGQAKELGTNIGSTIDLKSLISI